MAIGRSIEGTETRQTDRSKVMPKTQTQKTVWTCFASAKTYQRIDMPGTGSRLGFIAQDVEAACPSAWGNLVGTAQYSKEQGGAATEIKTLDYARLTAVLWQCTRNLLARVEALEAKLAP